MLTQSELLFELRRKSGISQEKLAEQIGVSRQTIAKWEKGEAVPRGENLRRLSQLYNVPMESLLGGEPIELPPEPAAEPVPEPSGRKKRPWAVLPAVILLAAAIAAAVLVYWLAVNKSARSEDVVPDEQIEHEEVVIPPTPALPLLPLE